MKCPNCQANIAEDSRFCQHCGRAVEPRDSTTLRMPKPAAASRAAAEPGHLFAKRYRVEGVIGRGGMGVVYRAEDTRLKRTVALNLLPPGFLEDVEARTRLVREAQAAAALDHPNICTVFEVDEAEGETFIAMAFIEGRSLKELLSGGPMDIPSAIDLASQAAEGLAAAHAKGGF